MTGPLRADGLAYGVGSSRLDAMVGAGNVGAEVAAGLRRAGASAARSVVLGGAGDNADRYSTSGRRWAASGTGTGIAVPGTKTPGAARKRFTELSGRPTTAPAASLVRLTGGTARRRMGFQASCAGVSFWSKNPMGSDIEPAPPTPFVRLAETSARLSGTRSRLEKKRLCTELLRVLSESEIGAAVGWLVEQPLCGPLGVGPAALRELSQRPPATEPSLTLLDVERALGHVRLCGRAEALARFGALFDRLTAAERAFAASALTGTLRQGSLGGVMLLALVDLSCQDANTVRRAVLITGSIPRAAEALLGPGRAAFPLTALQLFHPLSPMLASSADSLEEALALVRAPQVEWKVDGVRAQVHKRGGRVAVYSRQGSDITAGASPLLAELSALAADTAVLDGELFLVGRDGTARPFQDSFSALSSRGQGGLYDEDRLALYLFDCLHRDGRDLLDEPLSVRLEAMRAIAPAKLCIPHLCAPSAEEVERFYADAVSKGHEGVMIKDPHSPYRFGGRGRAWLKVKEARSVDLIVLAAEWGSGRRTGFLSNLHLGARREDGSFCMVGKTFKGLTDAMLRWQTDWLEELATERTPRVVHVRPELVVEIRYNHVQRSPRYPGGIALRFARVERHRPDKSPAETEPLDALVVRLAASLSNGKRARKGAAKRVAREADEAQDESRLDRPQLTLFDD